MAPRPVWKGYLKLSLVSCAVELTGATTQAEKVSFRILNRKTGNTVRRQYIDSASGKPVEDDDEIKGYEVGDGEYLLFEEDEVDAVQIESSHTLNIDSFVDKSSIEQIYLDTPYYMTPADEVSEQVFAVIREALNRQKMAGLARIVLYRRERPVVIEPLDKGLLLTTLRYNATVRRPEEIFEDISKQKIDAEMIDLATHIIEKKTAAFDPSQFEDRYEQALLELIKAKQAGRKPPKATPAARPSNVVDLFDALKRSLAAEGGAPGKAGAKPSRAAKGPEKSAGKTASSPPAAKKTGRASAKTGGKETGSKQAGGKQAGGAAPRRKSA